MAIEGFVKFEYYSKGVPPYYNSGSFPQLLDDESIVIQTPNIEMNYHQYYGLFKRFLMSVGFSEKNIIQGACHLAFNDSNDEDLMEEVAKEYDLIMSENTPKEIENRLEEERQFHKKELEDLEQRAIIWESRYWTLYRKLQREDIEKYKDYKMSEMKSWNGLTPGSEEAVKSGCTCPVIDNVEMPDDKKWVNADCPIHGRNEN